MGAHPAGPGAAGREGARERSEILRPAVALSPFPLSQAQHLPAALYCDLALNAALVIGGVPAPR